MKYHVEKSGRSQKEVHKKRKHYKLTKRGKTIKNEEKSRPKYKNIERV